MTECRCHLTTCPECGPAAREFLAVLQVKAPPPPPAARVPLPCVHLGDPLQSGEAARLSLDPRRTWRPCAKGRGKTLPGYVCRCKGDNCGTTCPDYAGE